MTDLDSSKKYTFNLEVKSLEDGEEVTDVLGAKRKSTVATVLDMVVARFFRSYLGRRY